MDGIGKKCTLWTVLNTSSLEICSFEKDCVPFLWNPVILEGGYVVAKQKCCAIARANHSLYNEIGLSLCQQARAAGRRSQGVHLFERLC